jgi:muconate cycloisomerase
MNKSQGVRETVERMSVHHLSLPVLRARDHGIGRVAGAVEIVLLRLETSGGLVGWGEASPWAVFTGTAEAAAAALDRYLRPIILGADPRDLAGLMTQADKVLVGHPEAKAAMEAALLDLLGRSCGLPLHALLGGRCRARIPLSVSLADPDFGADLELLARIRADGVGIVKLKTGTKDHRFDLERLERLRTEHADLDIRVDYNQGLNGHEALRRLRDIEGFGVTFIEQPVPGNERETMAALSAALDTPVLADESVFGPEDAVRAANGRIADLFSVKIMKSGGPRRGLEVAAIGAAAGIACYGGDMFESGIAHLAGTHMIAAAPNISLGCEFYQARWYLAQDVLTNAFPIEDGHVAVPEGPGLGFAVDEDVVRAHTLNRSGAGA